MMLKIISDIIIAPPSFPVYWAGEGGKYDGVPEEGAALGSIGEVVPRPRKLQWGPRVGVAPNAAGRTGRAM